MIPNSPLSKGDIENLLHERFKNHTVKRIKQIPHPFLFAGMEQAVTIIMDSMRKHERITIVGDYDVDGVVGTAILCDFFKTIGYPVECVIPNRFHDGYGLSSEIIERLKADLVITVDNGITAHKAAEVCQQKGIKLIITDHHTPADTLPCADVIINPKLPHCPFPQKDICGANVGWYLVAALKSKLNHINVPHDYLNGLLDWLALAIIADVMPLVEINRVLLKRGLQCIERSMRPAFMVIKENLKKTHWVSDDISYQIAPLLNSAGRLDDAMLSVKFLMSENIAEAQRYYEELKKLNQRRKEIELDIFNQALLKVNATDSVAVVYGEGWHEGVLGIVAAKLCERLHVPCFVLSLKEGILKGSGRSFGAISLIELLNANAHFLRRFGGHKGAVGLEIALECVEGFKESLQESVRDHNKVHTPSQEDQDCMGEIAFESIDDQLLEILDSFEPYGEANPKPRFICRDLVVKEIKNVGTQQEHTFLTLGDKKHNHKPFIKAVAFNQQYELDIGKSIHALFVLSRNVYKQELPQLIIQHLEEA